MDLPNWCKKNLGIEKHLSQTKQEIIEFLNIIVIITLILADI